MCLNAWWIFFSLYRHPSLYSHSLEGTALSYPILSTFDVPEFSRRLHPPCKHLQSLSLKPVAGSLKTSPSPLSQWLSEILVQVCSGWRRRQWKPWLEEPDGGVGTAQYLCFLQFKQRSSMKPFSYFVMRDKQERKGICLPQALCGWHVFRGGGSYL